MTQGTYNISRVTIPSLSYVNIVNRVTSFAVWFSMKEPWSDLDLRINALHGYSLNYFHFLTEQVPFLLAARHDLAPGTFTMSSGAGSWLAQKKVGYTGYIGSICWSKKTRNSYSSCPSGFLVSNSLTATGYKSLLGWDAPVEIMLFSGGQTDPETWSLA